MVEIKKVMFLWNEDKFQKIEDFAVVDIDIYQKNSTEYEKSLRRSAGACEARWLIDEFTTPFYWIGYFLSKGFLSDTIKEKFISEISKISGSKEINEFIKGFKI